MKLSKLELPLRTTLLYILFGGLWILLSDQFLSHFVSHDAQQVIFQTLKGWFFILVSGTLLYLLLRMDLVRRKLAEEEIAWLASFPERDPNPVIEIDSTGAVFYMNPAAQHRFPDLREQGFKHPWLAGLEDAFVRFQQDRIRELQREVQVKDDWYSQPLYYVPETARLRVYGAEITERKQAEKQTTQMKRLYAVLSEVNQAIVRAKSREELYQSICDVSVQFGEFALAWIGLLDESSGDVHPVAANGLKVEQWPFQLVNIHKGAVVNGLIATAIRTSEVVVSDDLQLDETMQSVHALFRKYGYHASAGVPFRLRGKTIGVLNLVSSEAGFFQAEVEIDLLKEMGLDISFALDMLQNEMERRQAEEKVERQNQRLQILREIDVSILAADSLENIVSAALTHLRELVGCRRTSLALFDWGANEGQIFDLHATGETTVTKGMRLPLTLFQGAFTNLSKNQPILINDLSVLSEPMPIFSTLFKEGLHSACILPLFSQGKLIGTLNMSSEIRGFFDEEKIVFGREAAYQVAIAITQNRLVEGLREKEERLRLSLHAANQGLYDLNVQTGNAVVNREYAQMLGYDPETFVETNAAWIERLHPEDKESVAKAYSDYINGLLPEYRVEFRQKMKDGNWKWILSLGKVIEYDKEGKPLRMLGTHTDITELKRAEQSLSESEKRFRLLFENNHTIMMLIEPVSGAIKNANAAAAKFYGYSLFKLRGMNINDINILTPDEVYAERMRALNEERSFFNFQHRLSNGEIRSVEVHSAPMVVDGNTLLFSIVHDITERKRAEEALRNTQAQMTGIFNSAMDAIISTDADQHILIFNPAAETMFRCSQSEAIGQPLERFIPPRFLVSHSMHVQNFAQTGATNHAMGQLDIAHGLRHDGEEFPIEASISKINMAGQDLFTVILRDITERKQAEEQIQRQLKHLKALRMIDIAISSSFDLSIVLDVVLQQVFLRLGVDATAVILFNPPLQTIEYAASRGFRSNAIQRTKLKLGEGYAGQAVLSRKTIHISGLMETGGKLAKTLQMAQEEFVDYYGTPLIVKGEVKGVLEIYHRSHLKADPEWLEFLEALAGQAAIAIDNAQLFENLQRSNFNLEHRVAERTTQLNRINMELEHANRAKDEFLANMSHELRTPLTSILGLSESLLEQRRDTLTDHQHRSLEVIESSGRHLLELINDILDLSKIEAGKFDYYPQPVVVDEICRSSLSFVRSQAVKKSITVTYIQDSSASKIFADPRRLKQILVNLLTNAVKFTLDNGEVILQVNCDLEQDFIKFSVIDNGIGIAPEDLQRLFQPFVQVDSGLNRLHEGTGLGLALVQRLTDLHGGSVQVESEAGKGSRFIINLPCLQEEVTKLERLESQPTLPISERSENSTISIEVPIHRGVILLADDNMPSILTIGEYLEGHGYEVVVAHDGSEALNKAGAIHPDLILMDIQMPVMNGLEVIAHLRGDIRFVDTPIIALTALAMPGDRERSLLAGASEYMSKPVSLGLLAKTINELLSKQE